MNLYAEIIVNSEALEIDRPFTYKVPEEFKSDIKVGQIVKVPFGKGNKTSEGFVLTVKNEEEVEVKYGINGKQFKNSIKVKPASEEEINKYLLQ